MLLSAAEATALADLVDVLAELGIDAGIESLPRGGPGERRPDAIMDLGDITVVVEVTGTLTLDKVDAALAAAGPAPLLIVANRLSRDARAQLRGRGVSFYDRSGHIRLVVPPTVIVDVDVASRTTTAPPTDALATPAGRDVAVALLEDPRRRWGIREVARRTGRDASSASRTMGMLRHAGLVLDDGRPDARELFWALAANWRPDRRPLKGRPAPGMANITDQLRLGLDDVDGVGWALTDTLGAQAWGAPIVASGAYPPDFYVPDTTVLRRAELLLGRTDDVDDRGCTVAVAPAPTVCRHRAERYAEFPVASHIAVALDLATDPTRGAEALRSWRPTEVARVW